MPMYGLKQSPRAWYDRINSFLTSMGFTKSKVDSNIYMKIMDDEPVILITVYGWFISDWKWETNQGLQEEASWRIRDERSWINALFPRAGSVAKPRRNLSESGKVCSRNFEKIWYVGL